VIKKSDYKLFWYINWSNCP